MVLWVDSALLALVASSPGSTIILLVTVVDPGPSLAFIVRRTRLTCLLRLRLGRVLLSAPRKNEWRFDMRMMLLACSAFEKTWITDSWFVNGLAAAWTIRVYSGVWGLDGVGLVLVLLSPATAGPGRRSGAGKLRLTRSSSLLAFILSDVIIGIIGNRPVPVAVPTRLLSRQLWLGLAFLRQELTRVLLLVLRTSFLTSSLWRRLMSLLRLVLFLISCGLLLFEQLWNCCDRMLMALLTVAFDLIGMRAGRMFLLRWSPRLLMMALKLERVVLTPARVTIWGSLVLVYLLYRVRVVLLTLLVVDIMKTVVLVVWTFVCNLLMKLGRLGVLRRPMSMLFAMREVKHSRDRCLVLLPLFSQLVMCVCSSRLNSEAPFDFVPLTSIIPWILLGSPIRTRVPPIPGSTVTFRYSFGGARVARVTLCVSLLGAGLSV